MIEDIIGNRFGSYTVISRDTKKLSSGAIGYVCKCDCGKIKSIRKFDLKGGNTKQCYDCRTKSITIHGKSHSGAYVIWHGMIRRCFNKNFKDYKFYGARGITVCDRWLKFENFLEDMGERPDNLTLDRINNNGNYEPSNCRWATWLDNLQNKGINHIIKCDQCNKEFIQKIKRHRFCSKICKAAFRRSNKIDYIEFVCSVCSIKFTDSKYFKRKTCSQKCKSISMSKRNKTNAKKIS